jgi:hypothetical protein
MRPPRPKRTAGRKPGPNPRVWHRSRPAIVPGQPVRVTLRLEEAGQSLRDREVRMAFSGVLRALHVAREDFRVIGFSLEKDRAALVVEADSVDAFSSGIRSLCIRVSRRVNQALRRDGKLFSDRYEMKALGTPHEVRQAMASCPEQSPPPVGASRPRAPRVSSGTKEEA